MAQRTEAKQDVLKQNFELTLIIIFIGLAFGLVGLIVQTAAVMSIVVISVGVIVGFVSYRDAFVPRLNGEAENNTPVALNAPIPQRLPAPAEAVKPAPRPQQIVEPLPRLPKIQRLTTAEEPTFSSPIKPTNVAAPRVVAPIAQRVVAPVQPVSQPIMQPITSAPSQDRLAKPRKPRARKSVDTASENEESKD